ncbi:hypothetical protein ASPBRDRAFT_565258 [Aspergillus brasiliensis CBS 101740]|uniref:Uncharacterized protein n=1 Tax=Aspergillus brasiliensis (strain CBS 101740 / IMI 381727 / IBT 21946) TaxID=767769 RepID=A0A1L9U1E9_ASPBC|nr:hypothetical protein ASPBRDRAFT_565258 [Aspergillus brasiliensis CBS 101740]
MFDTGGGHIIPRSDPTITELGEAVRDLVGKAKCTELAIKSGDGMIWPGFVSNTRGSAFISGKSQFLCVQIARVKLELERMMYNLEKLIYLY